MAGSPSSVFTSALTLSEIAMMSNSDRIKRATLDLYQSGHILKDSPFITSKARRLDDLRFINNTPGVNYVGYNADPVVVKGKPTPFSYSKSIIRNLIQVDKQLRDDPNLIEDPFAMQWRAWMWTNATDFATKFFLNQHGGAFSNINDPNAPIGLRAMLDNYAAYNIPSELKIDAGGIAMTSSVTASSTAQFEATIQGAFFALSVNSGMSDMGDGYSIYMPQLLWRRWDQGTKLQGAGGGFSMTEDAYDKRVLTFNGAKIRYPGRQTDQLTEILSTTETNTGASGSSDFCSVYIVKWGVDEGLSCWQNDALVPSPPVLNPITRVNYNSVIDWGIGIIPRSIRAFARIFDIQVN